MAGNDRGRFLRLVTDEPVLPQRPDTLAALADAAVSGDRVAVRTFLVTVGPHLLRTVRRVLGAQHPDVEDVAQECALSVMDALPRRNSESRVLHFVCRVAVLTAMNVRRRDATQKRRSQREDDVSVERLASDGPAPDARLSGESSAQAVRELLDSLPIEQAEVLALHCVLGYTIPEIADTSRVPIETLRSRLRLAKRALRERVLGDPRFEEISGRSS
jgi:RNA polymerase sigma-70 factor (ECF subfamily)